MTALIIGIIGLAVAPFFLLSGAFGAPKQLKKKDPERNDGPVIPTSVDSGGPFPGIGKKQSHDRDNDSGADEGDRGDAGDGGDGGGDGGGD